MVASLFALSTTIVKRAVFHEDNVSDLCILCVMYMVLLTISLTIIHLIVTKVGLIYTEMRVLYQSNEDKNQILNNLKEGVIILDKDGMQM